MEYIHSPIDNNELVAKAFSEQSAIFDKLYGKDTMISYKRMRVRKHVEQYLVPGNTILELNAGTGEDAVYFARKGYRVHATDISEGMLEKLTEKSKAHHLTNKLDCELCAYQLLANLANPGPYDYIFSNFAGLNCTDKLNEVLLSFPPLLKTGGIVTLVILPEFCFWETMLLFKGKFTTAFRRFFSFNGTSAFVEGNSFKCWYYNPSYIKNCLKDSFDILGIEGLCTFVPPSYIEGFADNYPRLFKTLCRLEELLKTKWPWKVIGDYYIISLRKK